jgi:ketosteroid isomerase-like protein
MQETELQATIQDYLQAFDERDLSKCVDFFTEDAMIDFASGIYRGKQAIEEWHKDRFGADLRVLRVEGIKPKGSTVTVDLVVTSKVARAWRINSAAGRATVVFDQGKIKEARFGLRMALPIEGW